MESANLVRKVESFSFCLFSIMEKQVPNVNTKNTNTVRNARRSLITLENIEMKILISSIILKNEIDLSQIVKFNIVKQPEYNNMYSHLLKANSSLLLTLKPGTFLNGFKASST